MSDAESGTVSETIDLQGIMELIPHRYPMLLIDRVEKVKLDDSAVGIKNVTFNEHFFQGHFPAKPVMPGVLIIEAMAQTAAVLAARTMGDDARGKLVYFMSIEFGEVPQAGRSGRRASSSCRQAAGRKSPRLEADG